LLAGQLGPLPLARQRTGAGRCPHRRYPAPATSPATRRNAPRGDRACKIGLAVLLAPGIVPPRKDQNQGRSSSLRCGRSTLILIFHGKHGTYQEDGGGDDSHPRRWPSRAPDRMGRT